MTRFGEDTWNNSVLIVQSHHHSLSFLAGQSVAVDDGHVPATQDQDLAGNQDSFPAETSEMTAAVQTPPLPQQAAVATRSEGSPGPQQDSVS